MDADEHRIRMKRRGWASARFIEKKVEPRMDADGTRMDAGWTQIKNEAARH